LNLVLGHLFRHK
jgi:hypothetical protein